jgi:hypothetical protein
MTVTYQRLIGADEDVRLVVVAFGEPAALLTVHIGETGASVTFRCRPRSGKDTETVAGPEEIVTFDLRELIEVRASTSKPTPVQLHLWSK